MSSLTTLLAQESVSNTKIMTNKSYRASVNSVSLSLGILFVLEHFYPPQKLSKKDNVKDFRKTLKWNANSARSRSKNNRTLKSPSWESWRMKPSNCIHFITLEVINNLSTKRLRFGSPGHKQLFGTKLFQNQTFGRSCAWLSTNLTYQNCPRRSFILMKHDEHFTEITLENWSASSQSVNTIRVSSFSSRAKH